MMTQAVFAGASAASRREPTAHKTPTRHEDEDSRFRNCIDSAVLDECTSRRYERARPRPWRTFGEDLDSHAGRRAIGRDAVYACGPPTGPACPRAVGVSALP